MLWSEVSKGDGGEKRHTEERHGLALNLLCRDKEPKESKSCDGLVQFRCHLFVGERAIKVYNDEYGEGKGEIKSFQFDEEEKQVVEKAARNEREI